MKLILVCIALATLVLATEDAEILREWQSFKTKYSRVYSVVEEPARFEIFKSNYHLAQQRTTKGKAVHGVTKFSDLTVQEFKNYFLMPPTQMNVTRVPYNGNANLPTTFDWKSKGAVTPVKDQGQCGSCWDFSATETLESVCFLAGYPLTALSEAQTLDCDEDDEGCNGGYPSTAFDYMVSAGGLESEASYPYTAEDGTCKFDKSKIVCPISSWKYVTTTYDENAMQNFCYANSPLSVCVDAETWQTYQSGVITPADDCGTVLDHCVQVTGWDVVTGINAWTVRNSWGMDWGVNGYIYVQIGSDVCAIADLVTVPCVKSKSNGQLVC